MIFVSIGEEELSELQANEVARHLVGCVACDNKPQRYQEGWWLAPCSPAGDKVWIRSTTGDNVYTVLYDGLMVCVTPE